MVRRKGTAYVMLFANDVRHKQVTIGQTIMLFLAARWTLFHAPINLHLSISVTGMYECLFDCAI